ncbi:MAG: DEAD/DEAH box helicase [Gemmatimonadetes bacterium]|nr:DEAD/DEAH box helicase [Gemmatimonadota bacterium]
MSELNTAGFDQFFAEFGGVKGPHRWQRELAASSACGNRLIRIPTGFGKTLGVLATWVWHRVHHKNSDWPRRLVWCLPMRVLVEQTASEAREALQRLNILWDGASSQDGKVGVHLLMGGAAADHWFLYPERDAVLIGTQDMLLSRAMNRGYASPRARWPMEFGLLNQDALWIMDEVQLMDTGLATSGQLQVFRGEDQDTGKMLRPCFTWWMSATLQRSWLEKSPDTAGLIRGLARSTHIIAPADRSGPLWRVSKSLKVVSFSNTEKLARDVSHRHREEHGCGSEGPTLVVLNTVDRAVEVWDKLRKDKALNKTQTDIRLAHSRFRPVERNSWHGDFLNRAACGPGTNRIVVSTQVIEAGVDISAPLLVTELAPWPGLVQRFGRCARWGGTGRVIVADFNHDTERKAAPYSVDELGAAREACNALPDADAGPFSLECFEQENAASLPELYSYEPVHLLLRHELDELFDTSPDLSGADIDISRFIRSGDERDTQVFWAEIDSDGPSSSMKPMRDELCSVPFLKVQDWLCKPKSESLNPDVRAWVWDWPNREWRAAARRDIYPGQTVLVERGVGGYRLDSGWDPASNRPVPPANTAAAIEHKTCPCWRLDKKNDGWHPGEKSVRVLPPEDHADDSEDDESLSVRAWQTIGFHGLQVAGEVERIADEIGAPQVKLLQLAGRWHDLGKAHPAFQSSIRASDRPERDDIGKAPDHAWPCSTKNMYRIHAADQRPGFRHELASTLGLFGVLQRHETQHQALLGPWSELFVAMEDFDTGTGDSPSVFVGGASAAVPTVIEQEILDLDAADFDLLAYLVCAHHGKVRMAWHASPADQKADDSDLRVRGVRTGDSLPPVLLSAAEGGFQSLPGTALDLSPSEVGLSSRTGMSWTERVLRLVARFGPFTLAWLETLLRAADQRASIRKAMDLLLHGQQPDDRATTRTALDPAAQETPR